MMAKNVPSSQLKILDIACWDLHARMVKKPLHALPGTKKEKILRYGDVRGQQPDFSPRKYAENVARYLERTGMQATKLHFPGNMGTKESIPFSMILETLQAVRQAVGRRNGTGPTIGRRGWRGRRRPGSFRRRTRHDATSGRTIMF